MLCTLAEVKGRLEVEAAETRYDAVLEGFITLVGGRFEEVCNRSLSFLAGARVEFGAAETLISPARYPITAVSKWEVKASELTGWTELTGVDYLIRAECLLQLALPLGSPAELARVTYSGGYVLPADTVEKGQTALPEEIERCAIEEVTQLWQNREKLGIVSQWEANVAFRQYRKLDLLPNTVAVLGRYRRMVL